MSHEPTPEEIELLAACSAPIACGDGVEKPDNGTVTFFSPGLTPIAVTNHHVYEKFKKRMDEGRGRTVINDLPFDLRERLIDCDESLDLATFRITNEELRRLGKSAAWQATPYRMPQPGAGVFISGYPGKWKDETDPRRVGFPQIRLSGFKVEDVSTLSIIIDPALSPQARIEPHAVQYRPGDLDTLGGLSGSPVLGLTDRSPATPVLFGVINADWGLKGVWRATRADFLAADGRIRRLGTPDLLQSK